MFCPNCGTQNESAATPCKKCGFKLSGISVPKFKGTMMLNSDQTVQELIDEHRRKAQGAAAEKNKGRGSEPAPKRAPGSSAPPSSLGARGPVLQPPRAAAPTRGRMGGTMMGVAPQGGALVPPVGGRAPAAPAPRAPVAPAPAEPAPAEARLSPGEAPVESEPAAAGESRADAAAESAPTARPEAEGDGEPAPSPEPQRPAGAARQLAPTRPLAAVPSADAEAPFTPIDASDRVSDDLTPAPEPARARAVAVTAPLPQQPELAAAADLAPEKSSVPPRLRALDLVLVVCTFGLYGIVLWLKRRKLAAA